MDLFGIGSGVKGAVAVYFRAGRQSGRTEAMLDALKDGDRVVFATHDEAKHFERRAKGRGLSLSVIVSPPSDGNAIYRHGSNQGRRMA